MNNFTISTWYQAVTKPEWAPPVWLFGVAWGIIYPLIAITFGYTFWQIYKKQWPKKIAVPFAINLIFNLIYAFGTSAVFVDKSQTLTDIKAYYWPATIVIAVVLITLPIMMAITWRRAKWITYCLIPYLAWIILATALQLSIAIMS